MDASGGVADARVFLGGVKSHPVEVPEAVEVLKRGTPTAERIAEAARHARDRALPMDNTDYEMKWRRHMAELYVDGALRELAGLEPRLAMTGEGSGRH
jgi:CO/xanthine dehydrogenase FAD-binding subunit